MIDPSNDQSIEGRSSSHNTQHVECTSSTKCCVLSLAKTESSRFDVDPPSWKQESAIGTRLTTFKSAETTSTASMGGSSSKESCKKEAGEQQQWMTKIKENVEDEIARER